MSRSLAFATDLTLRSMEGAVIEATGAATAVRTAANPRFRWGNFLLAPSVVEGPGVWTARHRAAFPEAGFTTIGIDDGEAVLDEQPWLEAGFDVERLVVLSTDSIGQAPGDVLARPLLSEADWRTVLAIEADEGVEPEDLEFSELRLRQRRAMVDSGSAVWLGIEVDGTVVATLGIADAGDGLARFQDVQTLRSARRRGYAGALITAGAREAAERFGSRRFLIVAEAGGPAIGLYRRLGFHDLETQVQLSRVDEAVGRVA